MDNCNIKKIISLIHYTNAENYLNQTKIINTTEFKNLKIYTMAKINKKCLKGLRKLSLSG